MCLMLLYAYLDIIWYSERVKNATVRAQLTVFSQQCLNFPSKFDLAVPMPDKGEEKV